MNRKEKRSYVRGIKKALRDSGLTRAEKKIFVDYKLKALELPAFADGEKVKLDYKSITSHPDYKKKVDGYKATVESLKDKICTIKYEENYEGKQPTLYTLEEDTSKPKWLFHAMDLIKIAQEDNKTDKEKGEEK